MSDLSYFHPRQVASYLGLSKGYMFAMLHSLGIEGIRISKCKRVLSSADVRKLMLHRNFNYDSKIFNFHGLKGGTGKTTLAFSLAKTAVNFGYRALLVDLDTQSNLTGLFLNNIDEWKSLADVIHDDLKFSSCFLTVAENLDLFPSNLNNSMLDFLLEKNKINLSTYLRKELFALKDEYDIIVIDCPPSLSETTVLATCAADLTIIPINPDEFSINGMRLTIDELKRTEKDFDLDLDFRVVINKYDGRKNTSLACIGNITNDESLFSKTTKTIIRTSSVFEKSQSYKSNIFTARKSSAQEDAVAFARELLNIGE